jgi:predicted enzyme related to lactoylglutathione lyase
MREIVGNIDVPNLEEGVAFYAAGLGVQRLRILGGRVAEMRAGSCRIYLLAKAEGSAATASAAQRRTYTRHWTPVHLDISVSDLGVALAQAQAAGAVLESGPAPHDWGSIAELSDPFGNGFCLIQFTQAGYDAIAN